MFGQAIGVLRERIATRALDEAGVDVSVQATVYTDERVVSGRLVPAASGPPDVIAEWLPIVIADAMATNLPRGEATWFDTLAVPPHAVVAIGLALPPERYGSIRLCRVTVGAGPYFITGSAHVPPGADPLASLRRRVRIELSDAAIEYQMAGVARRDRLSRLSVTRMLIESIAEAN